MDGIFFSIQLGQPSATQKISYRSISLSPYYRCGRQVLMVLQVFSLCLSMLMLCIGAR